MKPDVGCDRGLGCIICEDFAKKNVSFMLGERRTCPYGLDCGRIPGTGPTTCVFDCAVCLGRKKKPATKEFDQLQKSKPVARKSKPSAAIDSGTIIIDLGAICIVSSDNSVTNVTP